MSTHERDEVSGQPCPCRIGRVRVDRITQDNPYSTVDFVVTIECAACEGLYVVDGRVSSRSPVRLVERRRGEAEMAWLRQRGELNKVEAALIGEAYTCAYDRFLPLNRSGRSQLARRLFGIVDDEAFRARVGRCDLHSWLFGLVRSEPLESLLPKLGLSHRLVELTSRRTTLAAFEPVRIP